MTKRITSVFLVLCVALSGAVTIFAEEAPAEETIAEEIPTEEIATEVEVLELSLEDAINMALLNNPQVEAADGAIKSAELSLQLAKDKKKDFDQLSKYVTVAVNISEGLETGYLKHGYYTDAATVGLELETMEKDKVIAAISCDVTEKYYNVKLMEKLVEIAKTGLQIALDNQSVVVKNFELGYVSQLEVTNVENAVLKAQHSVENYERNLSLAQNSLKISLLIDDKDCTLILTDEIHLPEIPENADEKINAAIKTRYDCTALEKSYDLAARYFEITDYYVSTSTAAYHSAYSDYLNAKYTYENSTKLIALGLKSEYASILTAKDNVTACENDLKIKQIEYESAKIKYDMGLITNLELTQAMAELDSAKVQLQNAQVTYLLAVLKFDYNTTIGL